jgi:hypothetical protein
MASPIGEFTVVAHIGHSPDIVVLAPPSPADLMAEFGVLTKLSKMSRRSAVAALAKRHRLGANRIYGLIEVAKKSVE